MPLISQRFVSFRCSNLINLPADLLITHPHFVNIV